MAKQAKKKTLDIPKLKEANLPKAIAIEKIIEDDYPLFCFKFLSDVSIKDCDDEKFFLNFLIRLQKLSELGWQGIRTSHRHSFGMEQIPANCIIPDLPMCVTPEVKSLHVLRANGNNLPFVGLQIGNVFRIFFIETQFGDIYKHS